MAEIRFQPSAEQLAPGQTHKVPIVIAIDRPLKMRGLHATFRGVEETRATYAMYNAATKSTQIQTAVEHHDIVRRDYTLSGKERKGTFGNIADALATLCGGGDHEVLEPGEYAFEVEVQIPDDAPASFEGSKCRVFYELSVCIDIPAWRDVKAVHSFPLKRPSDDRPGRRGAVRTRYPEDRDRGLLDAWVSPDIRAEAALAEGVLSRGDTAHGIVVIEAPKPLRYRAITARLIAVENTTAHGHTDGHTHRGDPIQIATDGTIAPNTTQEFQLPVASPGAITARGQLFSIDCFLLIELDVPWAKDPAIRVPITLL